MCKFNRIRDIQSSTVTSEFLENLEELKEFLDYIKLEANFNELVFINL